MLTWNQKIRFAIGLIPAIVRGDDYVVSMDKYTFEEWLEMRGIGKDITTDIFVAVCKSLKFIDPDVISATIPLRALNKFLQQKDGSKIAYLDGAPPERLCQPIVDYVVARGGEVHTGAALKEIVTDADGNVEKLIIQGTDGSPSREILADAYVSAMSVDAFKNYIPTHWQSLPYFKQLDHLEGVPVISVQIWFDRKLTHIDHTLFSRSPLLSVYSDMSNSCKEYEDPDKSMLELVFAPAADWIDRPNSEIIEATLNELAKLFPQYLPSPAKVLKSHVVKTPRSIYTATPGREQFRPSQATPIANFFLSGSYTAQPFFGSMEGAVLSGKLTAQEIHKANQNASQSSGNKVLGRTSNQNQSHSSVVSA
jgi:15-cis-phytoene desaturase